MLELEKIPPLARARQPVEGTNEPILAETGTIEAQPDVQQNEPDEKKELYRKAKWKSPAQ
jgi:hypothetical protein